MANCSYARCIQERRIIKRELQRWTKGMVYIVGLERVAEELMGRRKWKLYQELIARSNQNSINSASIFHQETSVVNQNSAVQQNTEQLQHHQQQQQQQERPNILSQQLDDENFISSSQTLLENQLKQKTTTATTTIKCETINIKKEIDTSVTETENQENLELQDDEVTKYIVKIEPKHLENIKNSSIKNNNSIHSIEDGEEQDDDEEVGEVEEVENQKNSTKRHSDKKEEEDNSELVESETPNIPIDWKPQDKCYFCVDGKLLTVNENGDLVAESGYSGQTDTDVALRETPVESDSESSGSYSGSDLRQSANISGNAAAAAAQTAAVSKTLENLLKGTIPNNMTSLESMAATIQAVAALQGLHSVQGINSLYPGLFYQALAQPQAGTGNHSGRDDDSVLSMNESAIRHHHQAAGSSEVTTNAEQPLDLSAKPCASTLPVNETRTHLTGVRAKPRVSTVPGRRTYTEDELQRALQDIISGKLGTRRAAVLYGIPRSTLRNKVYKLSMEQKREALIQPPPSVVLPDDMEEKDVSDADDDKDIEKDLLKTSNPLASSHLPNQNDRLHKDNEHNRPIIGTPPALHPQQHASPQSQTPPIMHQDLYATNVMLQSLLFQGGFMSQKPEERAVFLQNFVLQQEMLKNAVRSQQSNENQMNNGKPSTSPLDARLFPLLQQKINCKTEPSELVSPHEPNEGDESNVILKIPSFKPIATGSSGGGGGGSSGNNIPGTSPGSATSPVIKSNNSNQNLFTPHHSALHLPHHSNNLSHSRNSPPMNSPGNLRPGLSPTLKRENSDSQSPPVAQKSMLTLHEVIASSISKSFQQQSGHHASSVGGDGDPSKRPQISVIKNLGGTDISRFAHSPNMMSSSSLHASLTGTGGKGTRPKRGKYRNYDRDSLVEAVKAVQRGEMSVHRAGSYYGVPHSTLEYKVKERHLMRPRKREPKPQPLDGGTSSSATSSSTKDISASSTFRPVDKSKSLAQQQQQQQQPKPSLKTPPPQFSSPSPNGMKMPIFDPAMAAIQYTSQLLWPHPPGGFTGLPMDFPRPVPGSNQFPTNPEQFFATQMMQKFQENSSKMQLNKPPANNLYDVTTSNGSLLDGIIRQSLDRGKNEMVGHSSLLDQLSKSNCSSSVASDDTNSNNGGTKRSAGSPLNYSHIDIKRERSSPITTSESDRDTPDSEVHSDVTMPSATMSKGAEHLLRIREDLTLRSGSADEQHQTNLKRMEDHNGGGSGGGTLIPNTTAISQQSDMDDGT